MDGLTVKSGMNSGISMGGEFGARSGGITGAAETRVPLPAQRPSSPAPTSEFANTLTSAIGSVNTLQNDADVKVQKLMTGQSSNLHETMIAVEKADIALKLMMQVRNKMIDAYHEVMKMQV